MKELKEMQDQIESCNQLIKQLASQKEMAFKKLGEMDIRIDELSKSLEKEKAQVDAKDKELKTKRTQLQALKNEEDQLKAKFKEFETNSDNLSNALLNEKQIKAKLLELQQYLETTNAAISDIEKAIKMKDTIQLSALCNQPLAPPPISPDQNPLPAGVTGAATDSTFDSFDPFANDDPFDGDDPFKEPSGEPVLPEDDPFNPNSAANVGAFSPFGPTKTAAGIKTSSDAFGAFQ